MSYLDRVSQSTNTGLSRFTGNILPSIANILARKQSMSLKNPYIIGKAERPLLTRRIIRAPHAFVPTATKKNLDQFTKDVLKHRENYDKKAVKFAEGYTHPDRDIKKEGEQRQYLEGEIEALVATNDRSVKKPFVFAHHGNAVALQTLRGEQKTFAEPKKPSQPERLAAIGITQKQNMTPYDRPWRTQKPSIGAPTIAPHAKELHNLGSLSHGALQFGHVTLPQGNSQATGTAGYSIDVPTAPSPQEQAAPSAPASATEPSTPTSEKTT